MNEKYKVSCALTNTDKTPKSVTFHFVAYSTERVRNPVKVNNVDDLVMDNDRYKSVLVDWDHLGESGELPFLSNTWIQNGKKEVNSAGYEEVSWEVYSENPEVIAEADTVTGGSIFGYPVTDADWYSNEYGDVIILRFDLRSFALLRSQTAGSGGSRLREKQLQYSMNKKTKKSAKFMYSDFGDYVTIKMTNEIAKLISKTITSGVEDQTICTYVVEKLDGSQVTLTCNCDSDGWIPSDSCPLDDIDASDVLQLLLNSGKVDSKQIILSNTEPTAIMNQLNEDMKEILESKGVKFSLETISDPIKTPEEIPAETKPEDISDPIPKEEDAESEFDKANKQVANAMKKASQEAKPVKFSKQNAVDTKQGEAPKPKPNSFLNLIKTIPSKTY